MIMMGKSIRQIWVNEQSCIPMVLMSKWMLATFFFFGVGLDIRINVIDIYKLEDLLLFGVRIVYISEPRQPRGRVTVGRLGF